jgi:hypothetical protein
MPKWKKIDVSFPWPPVMPYTNLKDDPGVKQGCLGKEVWATN